MENKMDERAPLLPIKVVTPVPKLQLAFVMCFRASQPLLNVVVFPFINPMLLSLGIGTPATVGRFSSALESATSIAMLFSLFPIAHLSERFGRKKPLLTLIFLACVTSASFGFVRTFSALFSIRFALGIFSGYAAISKCVLAEISTADNMAVVYSFASLSWQLGMIVAPLFGGFLSNPADRIPLFKNWSLFKEFPYALPNVASAVFITSVLVIAACLMKETHPRYGKPTETAKTNGHHIPKAANSEIKIWSSKPLLHALGIWCSIILLFNYQYTTLTLFLFTPMRYGGLGFSPAQIGVYMMIRSIASLLFNIPTYAQRLRYWGVQKFLRISSFGAVAFYLLPPLIGHTAVKYNSPALTIFLLGVLMAIELWASATIFCGDILVTNACPTRALLAKVNAASEFGALTGVSIGVFLSGQIFSLGTNHFYSGIWLSGLILSCAMVFFLFQWKPSPGWRDLEETE